MNAARCRSADLATDGGQRAAGTALGIPCNGMAGCALPLVGLRWTLAYACRQQPEAGIAWLLAVAQHPTQFGAAVAVTRILARSQPAVLVQLSLDPTGAAWVQRLPHAVPHLAPLVQQYVTLLTVPDAGAWGRTLAHAHPVLVQHASDPCSHALAWFVGQSAALLHATCWATAVAVAANQFPPATVDSGVLQPYCQTLQTWLQGLTARPAPHWNILDSLPAGWPAAVLAAVGEHLTFLYATNNV
ncbi:MAG: hypothetical protein HC876_21415 [Chloroflexaceae bacterium]|nr:hypothetical protein [Chloroflexaceae bacterium]